MFCLLNLDMRVLCALVLISVIVCTKPSSAENSISTVSLSDGIIKTSFNANTGKIASVDLRKNNIGCFGSVTDRYHLFDRGLNVYASEAENIVEKIDRSDKAITFYCRNLKLSSLNVDIITKYTSSGGILYKETTFRSSKNTECFIEAWTDASLDKSFRSGGYYYLPWPQGVPRLEADKITEDTPVTSEVYRPLATAASGLVNIDKGYTAASFAFTNNGAYTSWSYGNPHEDEKIWNDERVVLTPSGWKHRVMRSRISPGKPASYGTCYAVVRGDSTDLLRRYYSLPTVVKAAHKRPIPAWVNDVSLTAYILPRWPLLCIDPKKEYGGRSGPEYLAALAHLSNSICDGYVMAPFNYFAWYGGDYPTGDELRMQGEATNYVHKNYPHLKIGSLINNMIAPESDVYKAHPDWVIRKEDGSPILAYFPEPPFFSQGRFRPQWAKPEVREYHRSAFDKVLDVQDLDFIYYEGGDYAFGEWPDFGNNIAATSEEVRQGIRGAYLDTMRKHGEKAFWVNVPDSMIADVVQLEMAHGMWGVGEGPGHWRNWRSVSDCAYFTKLRMEKLFGTWSNIIYAYEMDKYWSYVFALAMRPNLSPDWTEDVRVMHTWVPFISAAYEIKDAKLADSKADMKPWWRADDSQIDVYALRQGNSAVVSAISQMENESLTDVSFDIKGLGFHPGKPLYVWTCQMTKPGTGPFPESKIRPLPDRTPGEPAIVRESFKIYNTSKRGSRLALPLNLKPLHVKMALISEVPAFVCATEKYDTQFRLTESMKVTLSGGFDADNRSMTIKADVGREYARIAMWIPDGWKSPGIQVDDIPVSYTVKDDCGAQFAVIGLTSGRHTVRMAPEM
ncbi:MAG: hypothetical protein ACYC27_05030 [Armatimonadota bacterium]